MYAVLVTGGKQYRVMKGETLRVELLDAEAGKEIVSSASVLGRGVEVKARVVDLVRLDNLGDRAVW